MKIIFTKFISFLPLLIGLVAGFYFVTFGILGYDLTFLPGDLGDTRLNIYFLEHAHQYFFTDNVPTEGYWNAPFMYPQEAIITFSDNLLGTFFIYSIFRFLDCDIYLAFQFWMISITILNYCCAYLFINYLLKNKFAATLGAFVFAFSIALVGQYAHPQTFPRFCIPIAFYFAVKFYNHFKAKDFFLMAFFVVYQFYCVVYLGFMLAVPLAIFSIVTLIINWKRFISVINIKYITLLIGSLTANLLLLLPLVLPYMNSPSKIRFNGEVVFRKYEEIFYSIPTVQSYLFVYRKTFMWDSLNSVGMNLESWWSHQLFPGVTCIAAIFFLFFYGIKEVTEKKYFSKIYWSIGFSAAITFLFYSRFGDFSFYSYLFNIPGFNAVRALFRVINVELIFFALFLAIAFNVIFRTVRNKWAGFIIVLAILITDNFIYGFVRFNKQEAKQRTKELRQKVGALPSGTIVSYEPLTSVDRKPWIHIDAMLVTQELGLRTLNGYSGSIPKGYWNYAVLNDKGREIWINKSGLKEEVVVVNEFNNSEIENIVLKIKSSQSWLESIRKQALEKGISVEEGIIKNAIWIHKENQRKKSN